MTMVSDINGKAIDFESAPNLMDAELCEQINNEMTGDEGEQWHIERYAQAHADKYDGEEFAPFFGPAW